MKAIQDWLGHSNFATTANFYAHLDYDSKRNTANTIGGVLAINMSSMTSASSNEKEITQTAP